MVVVMVMVMVMQAGSGGVAESMALKELDSERANIQASRSSTSVCDFGLVELFPWERPAETPLETVEGLYRAYARRDAEGLRVRTHRDFVSLSQDAAFCEAYPEGMTLAGELHMLESMRAALASETGGPVLLSIKHQGLSLVRGGEGDTAEVLAELPVLRIEAGTHIEEMVSLRQRFVFVRGGGEPDGDVAWRVLRWIEELGEPDALIAARAPARTPSSPAFDEDLPLSLAFARSAAEPGPLLMFAVALPRATDVEVSLIDLQGRIRERSGFAALPAGRHVVNLTGARAEPGIYWARLRAGAETRTLRVTVVR